MSNKEPTQQELLNRIEDLERQNKVLQSHINALKRSLQKMERAMHELSNNTKHEINTLASKIRR